LQENIWHTSGNKLCVFWRMEAHDSKDLLVNCYWKERLTVLRCPEYLQFGDTCLWLGFC